MFLFCLSSKPENGPLHLCLPNCISLCLSVCLSLSLSLSLSLYIYIYIYRVSQEECARLRECVPYVKVYQYTPKHLCPKLNGYGDNGQRKVWSSGGSTHCTCQLTALSMLRRCVVSYDGYSAHASLKLHMYFLQGDDVVSHVTSVLGMHVSCIIVLGTLRTTMT